MINEEINKVFSHSWNHVTCYVCSFLFLKANSKPGRCLCKIISEWQIKMERRPHFFLKSFGEDIRKFIKNAWLYNLVAGNYRYSIKY